jgi:hypothetical protein
MAGQATRLRAAVVTAARNWSFPTQIGVRCLASGGCRVIARATTRVTASATRVLALGGASLRLAPGRSTAVRIRLTPAGRRTLTRLRRLRVRVAVTVSASGRRALASARTLTLRAPGRPTGA